MRDRTSRSTAAARWLLPAGFVLILCLAVAGCGGGGTSSSSEATTETEEAASATTESSGGSEAKEEAATGEPIVTWTIGDVDTEGLPEPALKETTRVYQEWVNSHGGIDGRPLEAHFCDSRGTPTASGSCAREAVSGGAVASVASHLLTGDALMPVLEKGNVALFGGSSPASPTELSSKISFPMGIGPLFAAGMAQKAVEQGCKHMTGAIIEGAESYETLMKAGAEASGGTIEDFVTVPAVPQDYSPQVAEVTSGGAECVLTILGEPQLINFIPAVAQSGAEVRLYGAQGNFNENSVKGFESQVEGDVIAGMYPDISLPQWDGYREALKQYNAESGLDYNSLLGLGTWAAFEGFKQVVESIKGPINNETFLKSVATAEINLPGMVPPLNMAENWGNTGGPEGFERIVNRCGSFGEFKEGKVVPLGEEFDDLSISGGGTKPADCGPPFG
jgi:ABC-type branched-subunit amino acid transport system substrate-binding protein